jgi:hypothetical protein
MAHCLNKKSGVFLKQSQKSGMRKWGVTEDGMRVSPSSLKTILGFDK